ncbi:MAG: undecaprenyldiphospho-muramoylpentapeptide beta-N-acetylglucosaminyltransferase [Bacteroidales bacterium]|nr:undecaprenyldiphospho-muramoylpentapeptide beta-N-acetylglucosaminyltransferase [Bacteroidales bacterium]
MSLKFIISGGGTGGHIFPALSIANEIKKRDPGASILFVGALGRMEMEKVPAAGFPIMGLPVEGLQRKIGLRNFLVLFKLMVSLCKAAKILRTFKPNMVIGVGGYASGPLLRMAAMKNIPYLIQEQNSYAGVTNKWLARKAGKICVAYSGMEKYFPAEKIVLTGNPVREELFNRKTGKSEACEFFNIPQGKQVLLVLGGSLGARTINNSILAKVDVLDKEDMLVLWQTGRLYYDRIREELDQKGLKHIRYFDFINRMDLAYAVADVIISRAGAATISELCLLGKPAILVPSPNVAEDHQTKNAMALVGNKAALMVTDDDAPASLVYRAVELMHNNELRETLGGNCAKMALPNAATRIADEIFNLARKK